MREGVSGRDNARIYAWATAPPVIRVMRDFFASATKFFRLLPSTPCIGSEIRLKIIDRFARSMIMSAHLFRSEGLGPKPSGTIRPFIDSGFINVVVLGKS